MSSPRTLVLVRHSKAEQYAASDSERRLEPRGERDAADAGRWLARHDIDCDYALVSPAVRAVQTWEALAEAAGDEVEPDLDSSLYAASPDTALDVIRSVPEDVRCVVLVGHNPTVATLAQLLDDGEGDEEASSAMNEGYPTSALAVFAVDPEWADLELGAARVTGFHVGRDRASRD